MPKFRPQRKQGCATQFGVTRSTGPSAGDLNTPLIILDSDSEVTSDENQKVAGKLKMQLSPASDIDPLLLVDDETTEKLETQVIPTDAPSLPVPCKDFVEAIEEATREAFQTLGSSSPAWSSDSWEVSFERKFIYHLTQKLPGLMKFHGLDQVRIRLADGCHFDILGEKYKLKATTTVWGLCMQVSTKLPTTPNSPYSTVQGQEIRQSVKAAASTWRPWQ